MRALFAFLLVALFATASFAFEDDLSFEDALEVEVTANEIADEFDELDEFGIKINWFKKLLMKLRVKIVAMYKKVCQKNPGNNVCVKWAKENINQQNLEKFWREVKPLIKEYCTESNEPLCAVLRIIM
uniref:Venom polypeptide n=1 Tax=Dolopus genitalis TaxID=2488630 RepID=A0A3G5BIC1_DOLGE|nr:venom polypeptide [Dolopus genitalis]